jgi:hypothetical protein
MIVKNSITAQATTRSPPKTNLDFLFENQSQSSIYSNFNEQAERCSIPKVIAKLTEDPKDLSMKDKVHLNMQRQLDSLQTDRPYSAMKTNRSSSRLSY